MTLAPALTSNPHGDHESREGLLVAHTLRANGFDASEDGTGRGTPLVPVCYRDDRGRGNDRAVEGVSYPLHAAKGQSEQQVVAYQCHGNNVGPMGTVRRGNQGVTGGVPFIVNAAESCAVKSHARPTETARCIDSTGSFANAQGGTVVGTTSAVRRLTPRECERLMGLPDDWTLVPYRGKPASDGPRYKAVGNSMAVPVVRWIGERIRAVDSFFP